MASGTDLRSDHAYVKRGNAPSADVMIDDHQTITGQQVYGAPRRFRVRRVRKKNQQIGVSQETFEDLKRICTQENLVTMTQVIALLVKIYYRYREPMRQWEPEDEEAHESISPNGDPAWMMPFVQKPKETTLEDQRNAEKGDVCVGTNSQAHLNNDWSCDIPMVSSEPPPMVPIQKPISREPPPLMPIQQPTIMNHPLLRVGEYVVASQASTAVEKGSSYLPPMVTIKQEPEDLDDPCTVVSHFDEAPSLGEAQTPSSVADGEADSEASGLQMEVDVEPKQGELPDEDSEEGGIEDYESEEDEVVEEEEGIDDEEGGEGDGWVDDSQTGSGHSSQDHRYCKSSEEKAKPTKIKVVYVKPRKPRTPMNEAERNFRSMQRIIDRTLEFRCKACITRCATVSEFINHMEATHQELAGRCIGEITDKVEAAQREHLQRMEEVLNEISKPKAEDQGGNRKYTALKTRDEGFKPIWRKMVKNEKYVWQKWKLERGYTGITKAYASKLESDLRKELGMDETKAIIAKGLKYKTSATSDDDKREGSIRCDVGDANEDSLIDPLMFTTDSAEQQPDSVGTDSLFPLRIGEEIPVEEEEEIVEEETTSAGGDPQMESGGDDSWSNSGDQCGMNLETDSGAQDTKSEESESSNSLTGSVPEFLPDKDEDVLIEMSGWCEIFVKCVGCEEYVPQGRLGNHVNQYHKNTGIGYYVCSCGQKLVTEKGYLMHIEKCTKPRQKKEKTLCEQCGKWVHTLNTHLKIAHSEDGLKLFPCKICGEKFRKQRLRRHELIHQPVKSFVCQVCARGFHQATALKSHMRQHTNEKPYKCEECEKAFTHKVSLKTHAKRYHGVDMWAAQVSSATGRRKKNDQDN